MGRSSAPTSTGPATEPAREFAVIDAFDHKVREGRPGPPGVILVLGEFRPTDRDALVGRLARIRTPGGLDAVAAVAATRDHGTTVSILVAGLSSVEVPVGSTVDFSPSPGDERSIRREASRINPALGALLRSSQDRQIEGND